ncbi:uncharacterized protein LOC6602862 [Drosophila persimilis]|uniref:uncharacterized protein LOC6602862 n=1 Tax=Drosophila persimilis TaxID=7234 RepID=UPI000F07FF07|nr:uncharacterized protein LOC6602862 [Drosophila persimilis]
MSKTVLNSHGQMAASAALRAPLWRPVVLHYPKKLLPHGQMRRREPAIDYPASYQSSKLRCGLTQPYAFDHGRPGQYCPECQCNKDRNHGGGGGRGGGDGDMDDTVSQCSRVSRASKRSIRSTKSKRDDGDGDAPLSHRSDTSVKTVISTATLKSGHSKRSPSQETVKSCATVKSSASIKSNSKADTVRAKASRHSQSDIMPHPHPGPKQPPKEAQTGYENYAPMTSAERKAALDEARFKYDKLIAEYNHLPVSVPTLRVRNRKIDIERELDELDYNINMFDQPNINVYYRR